MTLNKYEKIRIDSWVRKMSQLTNNHEWKRIEIYMQYAY